MEAVYYNNSFLKEEAAAVCQEIYRVTLLSAPERAAQMLFCQQFSLSQQKRSPDNEGQPGTRKI